MLRKLYKWCTTGSSSFNLWLQLSRLNNLTRIWIISQILNYSINYLDIINWSQDKWYIPWQLPGIHRYIDADFWLWFWWIKSHIIQIPVNGCYAVWKVHAASFTKLQQVFQNSCRSHVEQPSISHHEVQIYFQEEDKDYNFRLST